MEGTAKCVLFNKRMHQLTEDKPVKLWACQKKKGTSVFTSVLGTYNKQK